jgi:aminoglycoside phosphotransferase (APT) family kinase protein
MDYVEGISIGPKVIRDPDLAAARKRLPEQLAQELATIHAIDVTAHELDFLAAPEDWQSPANKAVQDVRAAADKLGIANPTLEYGLRWCEQNAPDCDAITVIHGDFRVGNLLVGPEGLAAIIDWEFSHVGDPAEDLAWPTVRDWRFGNGQLKLGGIGKREPFIAHYEQVSKRMIDRKSVDYWEILGNLRWATTCIQQANRHLSGGDPSVEFASLGRRSAEMQLEMLRLIKAWKD